jgi:hypothetical protein
VSAVLFWNLDLGEASTSAASRARSLGDVVASVVASDHVDVLVFAEATADVVAGIATQATRGRRTLHLHQEHYGGKLWFASTHPSSAWTTIEESPRASARELRTEGAPPLLLVAAHLPSKLHSSAESQHEDALALAQLVRSAERACGHRRTVLFGDLNMDPFEPGIVGARSLHGVMDRSLAREEHRTVGNERYDYFYNPMWSLLGDRSSGPPGTYFVRRSEAVAYFWHSFDQVLFRPDLLDDLPLDPVRIVTRAGEHALLTPRGRPNATGYSDHLPLLFCTTTHSGDTQ